MPWKHRNCGGELVTRISGFSSIDKAGNVFSATKTQDFYDIEIDYIQCNTCAEEISQSEFKNVADWED